MGQCYHRDQGHNESIVSMHSEATIALLLFFVNVGQFKRQGQSHKIKSVCMVRSVLTLERHKLSKKALCPKL